MAEGRIPAPGQKLGPCANPCEHIDCARSRSDASKSCRYCKKEIGYDTGFYSDGIPGDLVHAVCLEQILERA